MHAAAEDFIIRFWGTRGSTPSPGPGTVKYGGNTACTEIRCGREIIILDAGTGIRKLGTDLLDEMPMKASVLFSHVHWDHIQGIPFFRPAYIPGNEFKLYGNKNWDMRLEYALKWQMQSPNFPVTLEEVNAVGARMEYIDIDAGKTFEIGDSDRIIVQTVELRHPDKAFGFRIEYDGRSLVYASDAENLPEPEEDLVKLASGADLLIHDAQYTSEEYYGLDGFPMKNRGHSTPEAAAEVAVAADVKKLVLFHHDPCHNDSLVDQMVQTASVIFPNTVAASEGMVIELPFATVSAEPYLGETNTPPLYSSAS